MLRFVDVTQQTLTHKLYEILSDSKYLTNAKEASDLFRDNPIAPLEESMYWIEYAARHRGTKVFKSNAVNIPWYIYYHLDIWAVVLVTLFALLKVTVYSVQRITRKTSDNNNNAVPLKKMKSN